MRDFRRLWATEVRRLWAPMLEPVRNERPDGEQRGHPPASPASVETTVPSGDRVAPGTTSGAHGYPGFCEGVKDSLPDAEQGAGDERWWAKLGYASFEDYLRELGESRKMMLPSARSANEVRDPNGGWHPALDVAFESDLRDAAGSRRQVGVKLSAADYNDLKLAADRFGITPTTFARLLIIRGVRSTLQSIWEENLD